MVHKVFLVGFGRLVVGSSTLPRSWVQTFPFERDLPSGLVKLLVSYHPKIKALTLIA